MQLSISGSPRGDDRGDSAALTGSPARAVFVVQAISEVWWLFFGQNCIATHESNGIDIITALILNDINPLGKKRMDLVLELKASECSVWGTLTVRWNIILLLELCGCLLYPNIHKCPKMIYSSELEAVPKDCLSQVFHLLIYDMEPPVLRWGMQAVGICWGILKRFPVKNLKLMKTVLLLLSF